MSTTVKICWRCHNILVQVCVKTLYLTRLFDFALTTFALIYQFFCLQTEVAILLLQKVFDKRCGVRLVLMGWFVIAAGDWFCEL
jgi:hypothetical protein